MGLTFRLLRLPTLNWPSSYYLQVLFHGGTNNAIRTNLGSIRGDCRILQAAVKVMGAYTVVFPILMVGGKGLRRAQ